MFNLSVPVPSTILKLDSLQADTWYLVAYLGSFPSSVDTGYCFSVPCSPSSPTGRSNYFLAKLTPHRKGNLMLCPTTDVHLSIQTDKWSFVDANDFYDGSMQRRVLNTCFTVDFLTTSKWLIRVPLVEDGTGGLDCVERGCALPLVLDIAGELGAAVLAALDYDATQFNNLRSKTLQHEILMQKIVA